MKLVITFALFLFPIFAWSQDKVNIENTVNKYITNFFLNESAEMYSAFHPEFAKRGLSKTRDGKLFFDNISKEKLDQILNRKRALPKSEQSHQIEILDRTERAASVKLITGYPTLKWVEYLHLLKLDGKWLICNIAWDYLPKN